MLDYEAALRDADRRNYESENLSEAKIKSFASLSGVSTAVIRAKTKADGLFRWFFVLDPKRQNFYEKYAADYIREMPGVHEFEQLPNNKLGIVGGMVIPMRESKTHGGNPESKTIDFTWKHGNLTYYASHKYTKDAGGAQGNQYKDLQDFLVEANKSAAPRSVFLAIADGPFYGGHNGKRGMTRMDNLKRIANGRNVFALTINDLAEFMASRRG